LSPMTIVIAINTEQLYSCHSIFTTVIKDTVVVLSPMTIMIAVTVKLCWTSLINVRQQGWGATMMSQILQLMHKITIVRLLIRLFHVSDNTNYSVYRCTGVLNKIVNCNLPIQEWTQSPLTDWLQGHETINCELSVTTSKVEVTWLKVDVRAWQKHHSHPLGSMIE